MRIGIIFPVVIFITAVVFLAWFLIGDNMRIGIIFPVVIFITAVVFLAWFFIGGYAAPGA